METELNNEPITEEETMFEIGNVLVSLDVAEQYFCCDISQCLGQCCIDGDAGAPITEEERKELENALPAVMPDLLPASKKVIEEEGVSYIDCEGDLVTQIVDGQNCVFTCYDKGGVCLCAVEKAFRNGRCRWRKPMSCYLYPLRLTEYPTFTAVNYHRWKICRSAEVNGRKLGVRLYEFMREPLTERFGAEWYAALAEACAAWNEQNEGPAK